MQLTIDRRFRGSTSQEMLKKRAFCRFVRLLLLVPLAARRPLARLDRDDACSPASLKPRSFQSLPPEPVIVNKVAAGGWAESVGFLGGALSLEVRGLALGPRLSCAGEEILVVNGESTVAMSSEECPARSWCR